jgi:glucosamine kinase
LAETGDKVVIGIDGGGTQTRVMVADLDGRVLSYLEHGASSIHKDVNASRNVQQAIKSALDLAEKDVSQVAMLTAGIAGFDAEADLEWVLPLTAVENLDCRKKHVNDAVVAHSGALGAEPGMIVIAGTGSIIYAATEDGQQVRNYDLHHYAASAARFLAYNTVYELLAGNSSGGDQRLVEDILAYWKVSTVRELSGLARRGFVEDRRERNRIFGELAPIITEAAEAGSPLAQVVCDRAIHEIVVGIEMLGLYFSQPEVKVSFIGSVANSGYFRQQLHSLLKSGKNKAYTIVQPVFSPVAGAVLLSYKQLSIPIGPELRSNLLLHPCAKGV